MEKINGLFYKQEYLCLAKESFLHPLHAYLVQDNLVVADVTNLHSFVGYSPLVFAIYPMPQTVLQHEYITVIFSQNVLSNNVAFSRRDVCATLFFQKIRSKAIGQGALSFYQGVKGRHRFLSPFHQFIVDLCNRLYNRKQGNVFLKSNLYKQVQIAYALPRGISLITVMVDGLFNLFPTDLHGPAGDQYYIISLRQGGKACEQVDHTGKILLTEVRTGFYKQVYQLGKNHMQPLTSRDHFPFSSETSLNFNIPLPQEAVAYRELQWACAFPVGIHKIHLFRVVLHKKVTEMSGTLAHVHNAYATWRRKKGLESNYLLR